ncbi:MAG TPA: class I SAM-dependent methyltransferase [Chthonomonadales bacterium]|nr:class I SAM-dependent methyltransferase [Chthonomonadales bacterium]
MSPKLPRTLFIATRGVQEYRATIPVWVNRNDVVLEIGCEWGSTTSRIARHCKEVIGTDISPDCVARARANNPELRFEVLDGFDVLAALRLEGPFSKVYIDMSGISGYRSLLDAVSLLTTYATVLQPQAIIIKSASVQAFASRCIAWRPSSMPRNAQACCQSEGCGPKEVSHFIMPAVGVPE